MIGFYFILVNFGQSIHGFFVMDRDDQWLFDTAGSLIIFFKLGSAHKHKDTKIYKSFNKNTKI